jgi:hypothetical protein
MPTPVIPFVEIERVAEAYRAGLEEGWPAPGNGPVRTVVWYASQTLGISPKQVRERCDTAAALGLEMPQYPMPDLRWSEAQQRRYRVEDAAYVEWARGRHRAPIAVARKPAEISRPVLPSSKEDTVSWLERRASDFARRKRAREAREWMRFEINHPGPFGLVFVGDPHVDDDGCDVEALQRDLRIIEDTPGLYGVGMGDWINNWQRKLGHLYGQQSSSESEAWQAVEYLLGLPIWLLLLKGNHDLWSGSGSPLNWMFTHGAPLMDWSARFVVASGKAEWKIEAAHNFPGSSIYNKGHGPKRRAMLTGAAADLYIAGDHHVWTLQQDEAEHNQRIYWTARARGYKMLDAYADQLGYLPQAHGQSITAICDPRDGSMQCFAHLPQAAKYLTFLQQQHADMP